MAGERDVLAEALHRATIRMREAAISEGTLHLCLAIIQSELDAAGYTLSRSEPDGVRSPDWYAGYERALMDAAAPSPEPLPLDVERPRRTLQLPNRCTPAEYAAIIARWYADSEALDL